MRLSVSVIPFLATTTFASFSVAEIPCDPNNPYCPPKGSDEIRIDSTSWHASSSGCAGLPERYQTHPACTLETPQYIVCAAFRNASYEDSMTCHLVQPLDAQRIGTQIYRRARAVATTYFWPEMTDEVCFVFDVLLDIGRWRFLRAYKVEARCTIDGEEDDICAPEDMQQGGECSGVIVDPDPQNPYAVR